jgi:hypothetical protein
VSTTPQLSLLTKHNLQRGKHVPAMWPRIIPISERIAASRHSTDALSLLTSLIEHAMPDDGNAIASADCMHLPASR